METPALVSIITPAYKAADFIGEAIRSVQAQDHDDWEMLIVDDGSPDATSRVVAGFASADVRVRLIRQDNAGPALARQRALDAASGRFIAFLDSDDYWLPGKLSRQLAFMEQAHAALSCTAFRRIDRDGAKTGVLIEVPARLNYHGLLGNTALATSTVIVDRGQTGPFSMRRAYYDDFVLWLELTRRGFAAHGLNEDLMRYRVLGQSVSRNKVHSVAQVWRTYRKIEHLSLPYAGWCFARYAFNAWRKYRVY